MVTMTCEALIRQALSLLDTAGQGGGLPACSLQAALDALQPEQEAFDIDAVAAQILGSGASGRVKTYVL